MYVAVQDSHYSCAAISQLTHCASNRKMPTSLPVHDAEGFRVSNTKLRFLLPLLLRHSLLALFLLAQDVKVPPSSIVLFAKHAASDSSRVDKKCLRKSLLRHKRASRASDPFVQRGQLFPKERVVTRAAYVS